MPPPFYRLMLITALNDAPIAPYLSFIHTCAKAGITSVQLREKNQDQPFLIEFGKALQKILAPYSIPLIVNDDVSLALKLGAAGVHVGQTDMPPKEARRHLGPHKIIGLSINTFADLEHANTLQEGPTYVTANGVFPSPNKQIKNPWGLNGLAALSPLSRYPLTAIGGITLNTLQPVITAGAKGVAVISALHVPNPTPVVQQFLNAMKEIPHAQSTQTCCFTP